MKAIWNGVIIAESNDTVNVEGNHYFPISSINEAYFKSSETHTACHWKGTASYYDLHVNGEVNKDAAWYYPTPEERASMVVDRIAFWRGVEITND